MKQLLSGKFHTSVLALCLAAAYNILRLTHQQSQLSPHAPSSHPTARRRLKTAMQDMSRL